MRVFVEIVEHGSLSSVARARSVSPSTITTALKRLEAHVGVSLLRRTTRSLSLTPEGERFLVTCRRVLADLDEAVESIAADGPIRGLIRVTATNDFGRTHLTHLIDEFIRAHPHVVLDMTLTDAVIDLVEDGYDLGIRTGPLRDSRLQVRLLLRGPRHICAAPAYLDRVGRPQHPRDLADHNCLVLGRPGAPQQSWRFRDGDEPFSVRVGGNRIANDGGVLKDWAVAGRGVVLKSRWDVEPDLIAGRLETVLDDFMADHVNLYAVHPAAHQPSRRVAAFLEHLHQRLNGRTSLVQAARLGVSEPGAPEDTSRAHS